MPKGTSKTPDLGWTTGARAEVPVGGVARPCIVVEVAPTHVRFVTEHGHGLAHPTRLSEPRSVRPSDRRWSELTARAIQHEVAQAVDAARIHARAPLDPVPLAPALPRARAPRCDQTVLSSARVPPVLHLVRARGPAPERS